LITSITIHTLPAAQTNQCVPQESNSKLMSVTQA